jgi:hypothetical protein
VVGLGDPPRTPRKKTANQQVPEDRVRHGPAGRARAGQCGDGRVDAGPTWPRCAPRAASTTRARTATRHGSGRGSITRIRVRPHLSPPAGQGCSARRPGGGSPPSWPRRTRTGWSGCTAASRWCPGAGPGRLGEEGDLLAHVGIRCVYSFHMTLSRLRAPFCCFTTSMALARPGTVTAARSPTSAGCWARSSTPAPRPWCAAQLGERVEAPVGDHVIAHDGDLPLQPALACGPVRGQHASMTNP